MCRIAAHPPRRLPDIHQNTYGKLMIRSMTGFARRERQGSWGTLSCELRTVNHRFLELSVRLPEELRAAEGELRQQIGAALRRGKVDASVHLKTEARSQGLQIDPALLQQLLARLEEVQSRLSGSASINVMDVLRWPGLLAEQERDSGELQQAALTLLAETLQELNAMRAREGARLHELLAQRCEAMNTQVAAVKARLPEVSARLRERLQMRLASLNTGADPDRLEQELVLYAHKMDVDEELDRLASHLTEIRSIIDSNEPAGRRLDFLMQELNREANTLSSKSQDVDTTRAAVELKVIIEQMREQIQNIE